MSRTPPSRRRPALAIVPLEDRSVPALLASSSLRATAVDDAGSTDGSNPVVLTVLANDRASGRGGHVTASSLRVAKPKHGTIAVDRVLGTITYTANAGFMGTERFRYTVRDNTGHISNSALVSVRVNRPTATDDWTETDAGNAVTINVLQNDTAPAGNQRLQHPGAVAIVDLPANGMAFVDPTTNEITYTPNAGFGGTDRLTYTVTDDLGATSRPATVLIRVNRPTAGDDLADFTVDTPVAIDVLANDTDPDGNQHLQYPGSVALATMPLHGSASVDPASNQITYTPEAGFTGTDSFTYTVLDDAGAISLPATVTVVGSSPTGVNNDFADTDGTNPVAIGVLANDLSAAAQSLAIDARPQHGRVRVNRKTGEITYTADRNFGGTDTFTYKVAMADGTPLGTGTVSVRVNRPTAADDWTDTDAGNSVAINVLANDTDPDGNEKLVHGGAVALVARPAHGRVTIDPNTNIVTYKPMAGFAGTDSFRYRVTDDAGASSLPATVYVRVNRPTATDDLITASMQRAVDIFVLANDSDPEGNAHINYPGSVRLISAPRHGTIAFDRATNRVTYTSDFGFQGTDTFRYVVTDDAGAASLPATVTILVGTDSMTSGGPVLPPIKL